MKKICKYDPHHWLMQDNEKNLLLMNEQTGMIYDFQNIQPERSKREDQRCRFCLNKESVLTPETCCTGCGALNPVET